MAASAQTLATAVLDQGGVSEDASLMRAAAQMYACAACIGTNNAATQLTQSVCKDMAQTPVPARSLPVHHPFHAVCLFATVLRATIQCKLQNCHATTLGNLALLKYKEPAVGVLSRHCTSCLTYCRCKTVQKCNLALAGSCVLSNCCHHHILLGIIQLQKHVCQG